MSARLRLVRDECEGAGAAAAPAPQETPEDPLANFAAYMRLRGLREATIRSRTYTLRRLEARLRPAGLLDATRSGLEAWQAAQHMSSASLRTRTTQVRAFYVWALRTELITSDPSARLVMPKVPRTLPRPISEEDLALALACASTRIRPWLVLAGWCGLRAGEIARLQRQDVLDQASPPVLVVRNGKGGKDRAVPLPRVVIDELHRARMPSRGPLFGRADGQHGTPTAQRVSAAVALHMDTIGVEATCHSLRHRYATLAYQITRDLLLVQNLLGHADPAQTAGYAQINPEAPDELLSALEGSLAAPVA